MQIFSKAAFSFGPGLKKDGTSEKFVTIPNVFQDMPDKFANDKLFKDCVRLGLVRIVSGAVEVKAAEKEAVKPKPIVEEKLPSKKDELEEFAAELKTKKLEELVSMAQDSGLTLTGDEKVRELRKMLFEAKKISE